MRSFCSAPTLRSKSGGPGNGVICATAIVAVSNKPTEHKRNVGFCKVILNGDLKTHCQVLVKESIRIAFSASSIPQRRSSRAGSAGLEVKGDLGQAREIMRQLGIEGEILWTTTRADPNLF